MHMSVVDQIAEAVETRIMNRLRDRFESLFRKDRLERAGSTSSGENTDNDREDAVSEKDATSVSEGACSVSDDGHENEDGRDFEEEDDEDDHAEIQNGLFAGGMKLAAAMGARDLRAVARMLGELVPGEVPWSVSLERFVMNLAGELRFDEAEVAAAPELLDALSVHGALLCHDQNGSSLGRLFARPVEFWMSPDCLGFAAEWVKRLVDDEPEAFLEPVVDAARGEALSPLHVLTVTLSSLRCPLLEHVLLELFPESARPKKIVRVRGKGVPAAQPVARRDAISSRRAEAAFPTAC